MSEAERPDRTVNHKVTVEDIKQLTGASTPHFALQVSARIQKLVAGLTPDNPAYIAGQKEIQRLHQLAVVGERRGRSAEAAERPLPSLGSPT